MRILFTTVAAVAFCAVVAAGTGSAAAPVSVSFANCAFNLGGNATVPAGSDVMVRVGWSSKSRGRVQDFLNNQTTTASFNAVPVANASTLWGPQAKQSDGSWLSRWVGSGGTLANPGDTLVVTFQINLTHKVPDGKDPDTNRQIFAGPGDLFPAGFTTCTITAV